MQMIITRLSSTRGGLSNWAGSWDALLGILSNWSASYSGLKSESFILQEKDTNNDYNTVVMNFLFILC